MQSSSAFHAVLMASNQCSRLSPRLPELHHTDFDVSSRRGEADVSSQQTSNDESSNTHDDPQIDSIT